MQGVDLLTFQVKSFKLSRFLDVDLSRFAVQDVDVLDPRVVEMSSCRKGGFFFITLSNLKILGFLFCKKIA